MTTLNFTQDQIDRAIVALRDLNSVMDIMEVNEERNRYEVILEDGSRTIVSKSAIKAFYYESPKYDVEQPEDVWTIEGINITTARKAWFKLINNRTQEVKMIQQPVMRINVFNAGDQVKVVNNLILAR